MGNELIRIMMILILCFILIPLSFLSFGEKKLETSNLQSSNGRTLYVGGNGLGNYSKIQDAIDNTTNNDTVFVYHDLSPYYENILINKSITLRGENKTTTAIDARGGGDNVVSITVDRVIFSGFSVLNWGNYLSNLTGMYIHADNCTIVGNIFTCNHTYYGFEALLLDCSNNTNIIDNSFSHTDYGIVTKYSSRNIISKNIILDCLGGTGILLRFSDENTISENIIVNSTEGIDVGDSNNNKIDSNEISHNIDGIFISYSLKNMIAKNNFRYNGESDAFSVLSFQPFWRNTWDANYWNRPRVLPNVIFGYLEYHENRLIMIPWVNVDWHPVKKPYNISTLI